MDLNSAMDCGIRSIAEILATAYPGTKWVIAGDAWPAGSHIRKTWRGGPSELEVRELVKAYEFPHQSGPGDLYWTLMSSFAGAKFVTYQRLTAPSGH